MFVILLLSFTFFNSSDSLRMETINGKPHVVHQVAEKETLYSISKRYGTTVAGILEQNPTADAGLEVGQILKVPYVGKLKPATTVLTTDGIIHKVAPKETLFSIARLYNVSVDDIKAWNSLKDNALSTGQDVLIRKKSPVSEPVVAKPVSTAGAKTHTVAAKETLYSIARQYGMTVQQLKEWNGIQDNELKIGQVLSVAAPAAGAAAATAASTTAVNTAVTKPANAIVISEGVNGNDEIKEVGFAELLEGTDGNRKYLAQHRTVKPGTILKIRNLTNNQEVFVRVTGPGALGDDTVIKISKSAYDRLGAVEAKFRAEITYYK